MLPDHITGLVLAGGLGRRMGGVDKGLVELAGQPMVAHVLKRLATQVGPILINANRSVERYTAFGYPVVPDDIEGFQGPLAGVLAGLRAATTEFVLTVPCDSPLLAPDLASCLGTELEQQSGEIAVADDGRRLQPVFMLLRSTLAPSLEHFLESGGRKIDRWFAEHRLARADLSHRADTFANVNDPGELAAIEQKLKAGG
ncbi:MAG TPA: molybdenum cofactor guanylyltransferase MobA [Steroidobacteraceae bacterium]|nr:molybdenum cofactor guanylyltransferase MobA [Steroidobacteraceae bacterium]